MACLQHRLDARNTVMASDKDGNTCLYAVLDIRRCENGHFVNRNPTSAELGTMRVSDLSPLHDTLQDLYSTCLTDTPIWPITRVET